MRCALCRGVVALPKKLVNPCIVWLYTVGSCTSVVYHLADSGLYTYLARLLHPRTRSELQLIYLRSHTHTNTCTILSINPIPIPVTG